MADIHSVQLLQQLGVRMNAILAGKDWSGSVNPNGYKNSVKSVVYYHELTIGDLIA